MRKSEKEYIERIDDKYRPLTAWNYFWLTILFSIPVIGFIFLIVFALSNDNINRRSYARSYFCIFVIIFVGFMLISILTLSGFSDTLELIKNFINSILDAIGITFGF